MAGSALEHGDVLTVGSNGSPRSFRGPVRSSGDHVEQHAPVLRAVLGVGGDARHTRQGARAGAGGAGGGGEDRRVSKDW